MHPAIAPDAVPAPPSAALAASRRRWLTAAATVSLALHLRAVYAGPEWQVYLFKPTTTLLVLAIALLPAERVSARYRAGVAAGLCFSLAGDVALMLPGDRFVLGLASFLIAHLCYLAAFTDGVGLLLKPVAALYALMAGAVITPLWPGLGSLRGPVLVYMAVITMMAAQAAGRWLTLRSAGARLAAMGAALFVVSDATLAIDRFGEGFAAASLVVMTTYIAAQLLIARSVAA